MTDGGDPIEFLTRIGNTHCWPDGTAATDFAEKFAENVRLFRYYHVFRVSTSQGLDKWVELMNGRWNQYMCVYMFGRCLSVCVCVCVCGGVGVCG